MGKAKRLVVSVVSSGALILALGAAGATPASAYAPGNIAEYQIGLSFNCQNPVTCVASSTNPFGIGGFWGWIELDAGCTGDAQLTAQGHNNADPSLNGTFHLAIHDITWSTVSSPPFGPALMYSAPELGPAPNLIPAAPGHYQFSNGPGQMNNIQINQLRPATC
jgi:hypothetical protein